MVELNTRHFKLEEEIGSFFKDAEENKREINYKWHEYTWDSIILK